MKKKLTESTPIRGSSLFPQSGISITESKLYRTTQVTPTHLLIIIYFSGHKIQEICFTLHPFAIAHILPSYISNATPCQ